MYILYTYNYIWMDGWGLLCSVSSPNWKDLTPLARPSVN